MKNVLSVAKAIVIFAMFASAGSCLTCRAEDQTKEIAAKQAEISRKHNVPAMTFGKEKGTQLNPYLSCVPVSSRDASASSKPVNRG